LLALTCVFETNSHRSALESTILQRETDWCVNFIDRKGNIVVILGLEVLFSDLAKKKAIKDKF